MTEFLSAAEANWLTYTLASATVPKTPSLASSGGSIMATRGDIYAAARFTLHEKMAVGFMDDMSYSVEMIFRVFGWDWISGDDVDKMSKNVHTKTTRTNDLVDAFIPHITHLNTDDVHLYSEARCAYDAKKRAWQQARGE